MFKPGQDLKKHEGFVRQIITRMKKQTRFSLDFNSIYKINQEIKRRTQVIRVFPNEASCLRLVTAVVMEISEEWETGKAYLTFS